MDWLPTLLYPACLPILMGGDGRFGYVWCICMLRVYVAYVWRVCMYREYIEREVWRGVGSVIEP